MSMAQIHLKETETYNINVNDDIAVLLDWLAQQ